MSRYVDCFESYDNYRYLHKDAGAQGHLEIVGKWRSVVRGCSTATSTNFFPKFDATVVDVRKMQILVSYLNAIICRTWAKEIDKAVTNDR